MKHLKNERRSVWRRVLFCFFGLIFLASAAVTGWVFFTHLTAEMVNQELRVRARKTTEKTAAITGTGTAENGSEVLPAGDGGQGSEQGPARQISMDFTELQQVNGDIIGWLFGKGTNIDYPVLQAEDNEYYLTHLYNGKRNAAGSLFADYRNHGDFSDRNTAIYGHHMSNKTMFGSLELYRNQDFYETVPTMMLYTPEGDYLVELISGTYENGIDDGYFTFEFQSDEEFLEYVDSFRSRSTFRSDVKVEPGDRLISLSTCAYVFYNARFVVIGRLVPLYENGETAPVLP